MIYCIYIFEKKDNIVFMNLKKNTSLVYKALVKIIYLLVFMVRDCDITC
jgi:hypothetical protein